MPLRLYRFMWHRLGLSGARYACLLVGGFEPPPNSMPPNFVADQCLREIGRSPSRFVDRSVPAASWRRLSCAVARTAPTAARNERQSLFSKRINFTHACAHAGIRRTCSSPEEDIGSFLPETLNWRIPGCEPLGHTHGLFRPSGSLHFFEHALERVLGGFLGVR